MNASIEIRGRLMSKSIEDLYKLLLAKKGETVNEGISESDIKEKLFLEGVEFPGNGEYEWPPI
jgi:hypothetical protein